MPSIISIKDLKKTYAGGFEALKGINLDIEQGEIFALLGPNGAGKTTLINIICGIVTASSGTVTVDGHDNVKDYKASRAKIGLVPQEISTEIFETVWATVSFSRGLFGKAPNPAHIESVLKELALWDKRKARIMMLSGGMKRRVMIAKALSHEPAILFLDEPTAGVDVELRRGMWDMVRRLREMGVTIILTTHYIEEAEEMADRIGVILKGELVIAEEKDKLMRSLGQSRLTLQLAEPMTEIPSALESWCLCLKDDGYALEYTFNSNEEHTGVPSLLRQVSDLGIGFRGLQTDNSSLEDIFVNMVSQNGGRS